MFVLNESTRTIKSTTSRFLIMHKMGFAIFGLRLAQSLLTLENYEYTYTVKALLCNKQYQNTRINKVYGRYDDCALDNLF